MGAKALINAHPKNVLGSKGARRCRVCANPSAIIRKYHLDMCRQCFRERALDIGFVKLLAAKPGLLVWKMKSKA